MQLFSSDWMKAYGKVWNNDEAILKPLIDNQFSAKIGYGIKDEPLARGVLVIINGRIERADAYKDESLDWELRASPADWKLWLTKGLGLDRFGYVIAHKHLAFLAGDPRKMSRTPTLACAFLRSFELMGKVKTTEWE